MRLSVVFQHYRCDVVELEAFFPALSVAHGPGLMPSSPIAYRARVAFPLIPSVPLPLNLQHCSWSFPTQTLLANTDPELAKSPHSTFKASGSRYCITAYTGSSITRITRIPPLLRFRLPTVHHGLLIFFTCVEELSFLRRHHVFQDQDSLEEFLPNFFRDSTHQLLLSRCFFVVMAFLVAVVELCS